MPGEGNGLAMNLVTLAWRNLRARQARTLTTMAGITLAVASFVILVGLARGVATTMLSAPWSEKYSC